MPVDGARLHVEALGPRDAPRVLMLHGALAVGRSMLSQAVALKPDHRVFLADQRGHGASTPFGAPGNAWDRLDLATLVADAEALVDALRPHALVGVSMGGIVSARVAARRPEDVRALALLSTAPADADARRAFFANADPDAFPLGQRALWERWHGEPYWRDLARAAFGAFGARRPGEYAGDRLKAYRNPALVLHGAEDELVPVREVEAYRAWLPHADVRIVPGDHAFFAGAGRSAANEALRGFLARALA